MRCKRVNKDYLVTQSNGLVDARYHEPLTARQQKIVLSVVSQVQIEDEDFKMYEIRIRDFHELLGLEGEPKYTDLRKITEEILKKSLEITREKGRLLQVNWFSSIEYFEHEGRMEFSFDPKLKPYLLDLKKAYTSYRLSNILSLNSAYSIRLYELMKKWEYLGKWEVTVENLKDRLGTKNKSYDAYGNFKNRIINPAISELNGKTDVIISFNEIKKGRKVISLEFTIRNAPEREIKLPEPRKKPEQPKKQIENEDVRERLNALAKEFNFDQTYFAQLYQGASIIWNDDAENELSLLIHYVNQEKTVKNPLGFIKSKLQTAWDVHQAGGSISFADLKTSKRTTGRTEVVPDWFNDRKKSRDEIVATEETEVNQEKKRALLESLGKSPEEIEKALREG